MKFQNPYTVAGDDGTRAGAGYSLHRAWEEITRDSKAIEVPETIMLDVEAMSRRPFAVAWLGHASMLLHVGKAWVLVDPVFASTVGPMRGLGPRRLAPLPLDISKLPHIDVVLISHDHYDHLDIDADRTLAMQAGGPPKYFLGAGLADLFKGHGVTGVEEFDWWKSQMRGEIEFTFVPAQHSSGRKPWGKGSTLWGGWVIKYAGACFYFAGDTAYVPELFASIHERIGRIDLAAIPIGAYLPRKLMQYEHMDPQEAVQAHLDLHAGASFGVHWGTFQLGDEKPMQAATDLLEAVDSKGIDSFQIIAIGAVVDVSGHTTDRF